MEIKLINKEDTTASMIIKKNMMPLVLMLHLTVLLLNSIAISLLNLNLIKLTIKMICNLKYIMIKRYIHFLERNIYHRQFSRRSIDSDN